MSDDSFFDRRPGESDEEYDARMYEAMQRHDARINPYAGDTMLVDAYRLIRRALAHMAPRYADVCDLADDEPLCDPPMAQMVDGLTAERVRAVVIYLAQQCAHEMFERHQTDHDDDAAWWEAFAEATEAFFSKTTAANDRGEMKGKYYAINRPRQDRRRGQARLLGGHQTTRRAAVSPR